MALLTEELLRLGRPLAQLGCTLAVAAAAARLGLLGCRRARALALELRRQRRRRKHQRRAWSHVFRRRLDEQQQREEPLDALRRRCLFRTRQPAHVAQQIEGSVQVGQVCRAQPLENLLRRRRARVDEGVEREAVCAVSRVEHGRVNAPRARVARLDGREHHQRVECRQR